MGCLDVAKDPDHPFIIKSQNVDVTVLGTSFNFRNFAQERMAELLLMEGSVEACVSIPNDTRTVRLKPGDKMRYNREDGKMDIERFAPSGYIETFGVPTDTDGTGDAGTLWKTTNNGTN